MVYSRRVSLSALVSLTMISTFFVAGCDSKSQQQPSPQTKPVADCSTAKGTLRCFLNAIADGDHTKAGRLAKKTLASQRNAVVMANWFKQYDALAAQMVIAGIQETVDDVSPESSARIRAELRQSAVDEIDETDTGAEFRFLSLKGWSTAVTVELNNGSWEVDAEDLINFTTMAAKYARGFKFLTAELKAGRMKSAADIRAYWAGPAPVKE